MDLINVISHKSNDRCKCAALDDYMFETCDLGQRNKY